MVVCCWQSSCQSLLLVCVVNYINQTTSNVENTVSAVIKDRSHQYLINSIVISVLISCVAGLFLSGPVGVTVTLHLHYKTIRINYMRKMTNYHLLTCSVILILTLIWCCCCSVFKYVCAFLFSNIYFHIPNTWSVAGSQALILCCRSIWPILIFDLSEVFLKPFNYNVFFFCTLWLFLI